ncbi:tetratricopeptide repeat (TPR)-like superfamily protein [Wolffia australiana]
MVSGSAGWRPFLAKFLQRCAEKEDALAGRSLHACAIKNGASAGRFVGNGLIGLYTKCRIFKDALHCLEEMAETDSASWNCLINGLAKQGGPASAASAVEIFKRMRNQGSEVPNSFTFAGIFTAAARVFDPSVGVEAHSLALKMMGSGDVFVWSSLVNMYCKLGLLADARKVFDRMPERNSVSWAAMLSGFAAEKSGEEAFALFRLMLEEDDCRPNEFVMTSVLSAVAHAEFVCGEPGRQVHALAIKSGLFPFVSVRNSLMTMYTKCGRMQDAVQLFESPSEQQLNSISWSAMITGHTQNGNPGEALNLFSKMHSSGYQPSEFTFVGCLNACSDMAALSAGKQVHAYLLKLGLESQIYTQSSLVDMYAKSGDLRDARRGFDQMLEPDVVLWTAMIGGYAQNDEIEEALSLYKTMQLAGVKPNDLTMVSILRVCSSLPSLELGRQIQARIMKSGFGLEIPIGSSLVTFYAKCGEIGDCYRIFRMMPRRDVVAWNSVISGFSQNGLGGAALELFEAMLAEGGEPDYVTFVNVLSACSHMGLVERGWGYLRSMQVDHGLSPMVEHYACMVDTLSRSGKLVQAKELIESVPVSHGESLWRILLGACRNHRNYEIGAHAGEKLMEVGSKDSSAYVLLANIYASSGRWKEMERVRNRMRLLGVNKEPGCSWMEFKNKVHVFVVGDDQHTDVEEIHAEIKRLARHMKEDKDCAHSLGGLFASLAEPDDYNERSDSVEDLNLFSELVG